MSLVGRLEDLALADIFQILSIGKKTGTLVLKGSRGNAFVVFRNGLVVRAETDDLDRTLGEDLLGVGTIRDTILNLAMEVKKKLPSKSVPEILNELGSVSREVLEKTAKKRVERVVYQLLFWQDGDFQFELDDTDPIGKADVPDIGWELSKGMSPEYLLMEGARVHDEFSQASPTSTEDLSEIRGEETSWEEDWGSQPSPERKDISSLKALTQELRFPNTSSEITLLILRFASDMFSRGVLFMVGDTEVVGLGQFGLDIEGPDEKIRETALSLLKSSFLQNIIAEKRPYKGLMEKDEVTESFVKSIGGEWPEEVAFFPIIAEGKVVALLFCDNLASGESFGETAGLEIFIDQAGMALEKSLLQRRI
ncbi:MAG: DUF4388 domain-containing protein, partial [Nitrospirota bacterium]